MSYNNLNNVKMVDKSLVDKILEQGQRLRNAMVGSILKNDPFNTEIIYNKHFNTPRSSGTELNGFKAVDNLTSLDEKRLEAFIKGEYMTKDEEKLAVDTLRSLSAPALCKTTERSLSSGRLSTCRCYVCEIYNANNLYCDLRRKSPKQTVERLETYPSNEVTREIQEKYRTDNGNILKHVDSMKVSINSLVLNEIGNQKVTSNNDNKVPYDLSQTYFLEYVVPDYLVSKSFVSKSKVNSGLENNHVRLCSRRNNNTVNFKQVTIHDVKGLDKLDLEGQELKFKISYRTARQKTASLLGVARFSLGSFLCSKNLTCHRGLAVFLNEISPIVVGTLKVSLQLGCGRLYFGQEFIDAINSTKRNSVVLDSDDSTNQLNNLKPHRDNVVEYDDSVREVYSSKQERHSGDSVKNNPKPKIDDVRESHKDQQIYPSSGYTKHKVPSKVSKPSSYFSGSQRSSERIPSENKKIQVNSASEGSKVRDQYHNHIINQQISENEKQILFGFLYISGAQYLSQPISTYITCRPFCQSETSRSQLVTNSSQPVFNFCQLIPLIFEDDLLHLLRENFMVIEFWQKTESTDLVIGLTKIFLHQFYLAYRNSVILKYLSKNQLPIIGTDWWEPIHAINSDEILGQVQVLVALGTEQQIKNLKEERGFTNNIVRAKFSPLNRTLTGAAKKSVEAQKPGVEKSQESSPKVSTKDTDVVRHTKELVNLSSYTNCGPKERRKVTIDQAVNTSATLRSVPIQKVQKSDVGIQSDLKMDKQEEPQGKEKTNLTQEMLGSFLNQLITQRQRNVYVENSTNTDAVEARAQRENESLQQAQTNTNVELRKTTDLLDSLEKALSLDGTQNVSSLKKKAGTFKANIAINSANHLPVRKRCKSKKARNRSVKNEENVLPSCYVTFETGLENDLKITPVISKNTSPVWNYKCDANLPSDLLTTSQKRLIFKVWRKSTNAVMQPNMQTDTVLGFAALDLTVLLAGFPNVQGWFNIVDFSGKCNGQINIHITPLESLSKYLYQAECDCNLPVQDPENDETHTDEDAEPSETLSRALKRKFTELDEITQRLRLRLSKVTSEDSDASSDGAAEEFERDINTLCIEEDFDLINFEDESRKFNRNYNREFLESEGNSKVSLPEGLVAVDGRERPQSSGESMQGTEDKGPTGSGSGSSSEVASNVTVGLNTGTEKELAALDKQLLQGKQRIDTLLEKLSLLSTDTNNPFTSRYVSGCSINNDHAANIDTEAILKDLDHESRPNIQSCLNFDPIAFQQLYGASTGGNSKSSSLSTPQTSNTNSSSGTSLITNFSDGRPAPDGQGNMSDERLGKK